MAEADRDYARLMEAVRDAGTAAKPLRISGGGSKARLLGRLSHGEALDVLPCSGIVNYQPSEMVITARAGTTIAELAAQCAEHGQQLPFEPLAQNGATLGGTVASGLSGPARPWRGALRDAVLGLRLINGRGELLRFGGEVMKNVAGYDVSRLQCGALGTLGVIAEVSLRLLPVPPATRSYSWTSSADDALEQLRTLAGTPAPLSGACWYNNQAHVRFDGSAEALAAIETQLPDRARESACESARESDSPPWASIREFTLDALKEGPLWCLSVAPASPLGTPAPALIDWAGARRFYRSDDAEAMHALAATGGGHAQRLWGGNEELDTLAEPAPALRAIQQRLKASFDPQGLFNPGRLYAWQ